MHCTNGWNDIIDSGETLLHCNIDEYRNNDENQEYSSANLNTSCIARVVQSHFDLGLAVPVYPKCCIFFGTSGPTGVVDKLQNEARIQVAVTSSQKYYPAVVRHGQRPPPLIHRAAVLPGAALRGVPVDWCGTDLFAQTFDGSPPAATNIKKLFFIEFFVKK